jgi:hypothetical protein
MRLTKLQMNTVKAWTDYVSVRHDHSYSFLGNRSVASVNVGRVRAVWICNYGVAISAHSEWT